MLIRLGFDIQFEIPSPVPMIALYLSLIHI